MKELMHVHRKQENSRYCLVCGLENTFGLKARFYELENGELMAVFVGDVLHQSYPGRLHGGASSAILDEAIGRAIMISAPEQFGVTVELQVKFKKPVPLGQELKVISRIDKKTRRTFEGSGEILLQDGSIAVVAKGKYMIMDIEKISDGWSEEDWKVVPEENDPKYVSY